MAPSFSNPRLSRSGSLSLLVTLILAAPLSAQEPARTVEPLWPGGAPGAGGSGEGDMPKLIVTRVESDAPTAAVVILPGGGYHTHAIDHEGYQFADWFHSLGMTSAICTYRVRGKGNDGQGYGHPAPMEDAQRAIQTVRSRAAEWNVDPERIGVIGFSAGGHLASTVSTHFADVDPEAGDPIRRVSSRPDFCILAYPVIAFGRSYTHGGSQRNLLGEHPSRDLIAEMSNERRVSPQTPPTFLFHTGDDRVVSVRNSIDYYLACQDQGVPAEMHLFQAGRHGLGLAADQPGAGQWPDLCASWLRRLGIVTESAETR